MGMVLFRACAVLIWDIWYGATAAIPLPLVKKLMGPYLLFLSSTINGSQSALSPTHSAVPRGVIVQY
eukprot:2092971-Rhodomonas_salina.1